MNVLVACEESQRVCLAFRARGHNAFSCDLQSCSGGYPQYHIKGDCLPLLNGRCSFVTENGEKHTISDRWDLIIAHPPCTFFSNATMVNLGRKDMPHIFNDDWRSRFYSSRASAFDFVVSIFNADCERICVENVVGYLSTHWMKPSQYIEPYFFGDPWRKKTCLWLKNLPLLVPTNVVEPSGKWVRHTLKTKDDLIGYSLCGRYTAKDRSTTFYGIADAMAMQWG